jgi:hypothetical protein
VVEVAATPAKASRKPGSIKQIMPKEIATSPKSPKNMRAPTSTSDVLAAA